MEIPNNNISSHHGIKESALSDEEEISKAVASKVVRLSNQLVESLDKQVELESELDSANQKFIAQRTSLENSIKSKDEEILAEKNDITELTIELKKVKDELVKEKAERIKAEESANQLNQEVEDLTASLFDEANNMVADARREKAEIEVRNTKLVSQLKEKDAVLETLELQLKNLKVVLQDIQEEKSNEKRNSVFSDVSLNSTGKDLDGSSSNRNLTTNTATTTTSNISLTKHHSSTHGETCKNNIFFTPRVSNIRYDLPLYEEFIKFISALPHCKTIKQTATDSKLLRRLVNDEIQPVLKLDNANGLGWVVKRTLLPMMMEGLVKIEPISGVNELYTHSSSHPANSNNNNNKLTKTTSTSTSASDDLKLAKRTSHLFSFPTDSPPVAVRESCAFCSESRDDKIEHARIHTLKTQSKSESGKISVTNQFPICQNCVVKVRQVCQIFAFLRSLKSGTWKLESIRTNGKDISEMFSHTTNTSMVKSYSNETSFSSDQLKKKSKKKNNGFMNALGLAPPTNTNSKEATPLFNIPLTVVDSAGQPTTNIQRAWLQLCKLRIMLQWAHIGIWNTEDCLESKFFPVGYTNQNDTNDHASPKHSLTKDDVNDLESFSLKQENEDKFDLMSINNPRRSKTVGKS